MTEQTVRAQGRTTPGYPTSHLPLGEPEPMSKYFADGDMVFSHFIAGLAAGFPPGEESFIRSVRKFADQITDPVLQKRVGHWFRRSTSGQGHRIACPMCRRRSDADRPDTA
ncbi:metal-dependent hydrolase [Nocardia sp. NPDC004278]